MNNTIIGSNIGENVGRGLAPAETLFQTTDKVVWVNFFFRFIFNVHISNVIILQRNIFKLKPHNNGGREATRPTRDLVFKHNKKQNPYFKTNN